MIARTPSARNSGVAPAVASEKQPGAGVMGPGSGRETKSSSSSTFRAIAPAD